MCRFLRHWGCKIKGRSKDLKQARGPSIHWKRNHSERHSALMLLQRPHPILRWTPPQRPSSSSTIGILEGGIRCPYNKFEAHTPTTELGALKHTTNLSQQQHTSNNQWSLGFLHKETLDMRSLKWMRGVTPGDFPHLEFVVVFFYA